MSIITLIQTFDDLYIDSSQPDTNFNSSPAMWIGKQADGVLERSLIKFDLSFIPAGSAIISSNLNLYIDYDASGIGSEATIIPYAISDSWDISTVTWNNQPAINDAITGLATDVSNPGYYSWIITNLVDQWVNGGLANNGLELKTEEIDSEENKRFISSNETEPEKQAFKPVFVIQYNPGSPVSLNLNAVIAGHNVVTEHEEVTTGDVFESTVIRNTSDRPLVSFFVNNLSANLADVGIEVSTDGVNFLRENYNSISQGLQILIPSYDATYTRIYYKSNISGNPTSLSIDYVAQA